MRDYEQERQWRGFLDKIGLDIQRKLLPNPEGRERIRSDAALFARMRETRANQIAEDRQERIEHWQRVKREPRLRDKTADFSEEGLTWIDGWSETARDVPPLKDAARITYTVDGKKDLFSAVGGPKHEMPADLSNRYIAVLKNLNSPDWRAERAIIEAQMAQSPEPEWVHIASEWQRFLEDDGYVFGYWTLPSADMSPDVDAWLDEVSGTHPPDVKLLPLDAEEARIRRHVIVAALHDRIVDPDQRITAEIWPEELRRMVIDRLEHGPQHGLTETVIQVVWNTVETALRNSNGPSNMADPTNTDRMPRTPVNEQHAHAMTFEGLLQKPGGRDRLIYHKNVFNDWCATWSQEDKKWLEENRKWANSQHEVREHLDRLNTVNSAAAASYAPFDEKAKQKDPPLTDTEKASLSAAKKSVARRQRKDRHPVAIQLQRTRKETPRPRPFEPSPWARLRSIATLDPNPRPLGLTMFLYPREPDPPVNDDERILSLRYVRLAILHDLGLEKDACIKRAATDLDTVEVNRTRKDMENRWASWRPVIEMDLDIVKNEIAENAGTGDGPSEVWQVPWDETNRDYMQSGKARVEFTQNKMPGSTLSEKLGTIPVHFMRKPGKGARVHQHEFEQWARKKYPTAYITDEERESIADEVTAGREALKRSLRRQ